LRCTAETTGDRREYGRIYYQMIKEELPYFSHDNNALSHPKMQALLAEYGFDGYGRFWALNEKIAQADEARMDISRKINRLALAQYLSMKVEEMDKFLAFLSDPEVDLINFSEGIITTDRTQENYEYLKTWRDKNRKKYEHKKSKPDMNSGKNDDDSDENSDEHNAHSNYPGENENYPGEISLSKVKVKEKKVKKMKYPDSDESGLFDPLPEKTKPEKPPPSPSENSESLQEAESLARLMISEHRKEFPDYLGGKDTSKIVSRWALDIEKLIRVDKKYPDNIYKVILWIKTKGNFWFTNIESGKKLREKFERLYEQMLLKARDEPQRDSKFGRRL
jgi:hypothetical protein